MVHSAFFFAYIDPGTGSIIWQVVAAAVVTGGFAFRYAWRRLRGFLKRSPKQDEPAKSNQELQAEGHDEHKRE